MKPGPAPVPTVVKKLEGNPGKRALNENEPRPTAGCEPPAYLPRIAKREWRRVYSELDRLGLVTVVDQHTLGCYCIAVDSLVRATKALRPTKENRTPEVQVSDSGYETVSGAEQMRRRAMDDIRKFSAEFGFSPAARSRISVTVPSGDDLESLLMGDEPN